MPQIQNVEGATPQIHRFENAIPQIQNFNIRRKNNFKSFGGFKYMKMKPSWPRSRKTSYLGFIPHNKEDTSQNTKCETKWRNRFIKFLIRQSAKQNVETK
jgi:hypothetical protein